MLSSIYNIKRTHYPMSGLLINISRKQAYLFAGFLVFFEFLTYISNDMVMPGMLIITHYFHAPDKLVATSLVMYLLGGASLQLFIGPISDAIGRRPIMILGAILFFVFTLNLYFSNSINHFLLGRFLQGMGLCFLIIGYATIQELFTELEAVRLISLLANTAIIAPLIGPLIGAFFILHWSWRNLYLITACFSFVTIFGIWWYMPETINATDKEPHLLPKTSLHPLEIAKNYLCLCMHGEFMLLVLALGLINTPCLAWIGISPIILMSKAKLTLVQYALWQIPFFGAYILGNIILRHLILSHSLITIIKIGSSVVLLGLLMMSGLPFFYPDSYLALILGLVIYGLGLGITTGPLTRHTLFITHISKGTANAFINVLDLLIMGLGTEMANYIYKTQNNLYFGVFCGTIGVMYFVLVLFNIRAREQ